MWDWDDPFVIEGHGDEDGVSLQHWNARTLRQRMQISEPEPKREH